MLDKLSQEIIQELQKDGRRSHRDLARKLGVAEGTIRNRVRRLRNNNILKIVAVPNPQELGYGFICIIGLEVKLAKLQQVAKKLAQSPNVYYLTHATGHFDLFIIVIFRTPQRLSAFVREEIASLPGIVRSETFVNMDIVKSPWSDDLNIEELLKP